MLFFNKKENLKVDFRNFKKMINDFYLILENHLLCYGETSFKDLINKYKSLTSYLHNIEKFDQKTINELKKIYFEYQLDKLTLDEFNYRILLNGVIKEEKKTKGDEELIKMIEKGVFVIRTMQNKKEILKKKLSLGCEKTRSSHT